MQPSGPRHDPALDGLRGLAVLIVLLSHGANVGLPVLPGFSLSGIGKSGVYLFFVLSAFLLTRLLLGLPRARWREADTWIDYALRRVLRIWPLYLVVLFASVAATTSGALPWWPYAIDGASLLRHLALQEGVSVLWSIPVEFKYYVWLPAVAALLAVADRLGGVWLAALAAAALSAGALAVWPPAESLVNDVRLGPYLMLFFAGALAAVVSLRVGEAAAAPGRIATAAGAAAALALLASVPSSVAALGLAAFEPALNHRWFAFFAVAWSALLLAVLHGARWLQRPFEMRPMRWLGWISFSAYLWHMPVLAAVLGPLGLSGAPALAAFAAGTVVVSWVSWRLVERPLQRVRWRDGRLAR